MPRPRHYSPRNRTPTLEAKAALRDAIRTPLRRLDSKHWIGLSGRHNSGVILRSIDRGELDFDPFTDTICVTTKGAEFAAQ